MNHVNLNESPIFLVHSKFYIQAGLNKYELFQQYGITEKQTKEVQFPHFIKHA